MHGQVPRSPYLWCPDCEGAGVFPDAAGVLLTCQTCGGQGRLKKHPEPADAPQSTAPVVSTATPTSAGEGDAAAAPVVPQPAGFDDARDSAPREHPPAAVAGPDTAAMPGAAGRPSAGQYFMGFAEHAAIRSKDSTKVGAVLVGPHGEVRLTGYNGPPKGVKDTPDRFERPRKYLFSSHAEQNVIAFAARQGIRTGDCTLYVTHHPCSSCARSIIQAGIVCVVVGGAGFGGEWGEEIEAARLMFAEAGVALRDA